MALVYHFYWESRLPLTLSLSDSEPKFFVRCPRRRRAPNNLVRFAGSLRLKPYPLKGVQKFSLCLIALRGPLLSIMTRDDTTTKSHTRNRMVVSLPLKF
jgi:hypothetical protein